MFPFIGQEEPPVRPLTDEDQHLLLGLVRKYGIPSLINALNFPGPSCKYLDTVSPLAPKGGMAAIVSPAANDDLVL